MLAVLWWTATWRVDVGSSVVDGHMQGGGGQFCGGRSHAGWMWAVLWEPVTCVVGEGGYVGGGHMLEGKGQLSG